MKRIEYAPDGEPIADAKAHDRALAFLRGQAEYIKVSSEIFINAIRALIHDRRIPHQEVVFVFQGQELHPDKHGRLNNWPNGFCHYTERFLMRLLEKYPDTDHPLEPDDTIVGSGSPIDAAVVQFTSGKIDDAGLVAVLASNGIPESLVRLVAGMAIDYPIRA